MKTVKERVSNAASSDKAHAEIYKAKVEENAEKATARTEEDKEIAHQLRKAKEAKAKMELHQAKVEHAAEKLRSKQSHLYRHHHTQDPKLSGTQYVQNEAVVGSHRQLPVGQEASVARATLPVYPLGGTAPGMQNKHI